MSLSPRDLRSAEKRTVANAVNSLAVSEDVELDIPGGLPQSVELGPAFDDAPRRLPADVVLATLDTFAPPAAAALAIYLYVIGWYSPTWIEVSLLLGMHFVAILGIEVGFHRMLAHGAFQCHRAVKILLVVFGSFAFHGPVIWWVYIHRRHHRFSDKPNDPHSMYLFGDGFWARARGFVHAHIGWIWVPSSIRAPGWRGYVRDLYRDLDLLRLQTNYVWLVLVGLLIPTVLGGLLHMSWKGAVLGLLFGGPLRMLSSNHLTFFGVNSLSHCVGARPYKTQDYSTNSIPLLFALPTLGQSYHNNHHAFPSYWRAGHRWYEIDLGAYVLWVLHKWGLVWGFREPSPELLARKRRTPDVKSSAHSSE